ncbi:MAG TPA: hypothetical protein HA263_07105 [Methanoregulaceae archaeon]|nr:hypothetical protein [Methanoregulaceae archaeon]
MRTGLLWDAPVTFQRYVEDCGASCELVTPQLCAAPFFRGSFGALIVPTGFANPVYSKTLVALRASSDRVRRYLERGGALVVFGAAIDRPDAYDWLPFRLVYRHQYGPCRVEPVESGLFEALFGGYDAAALECDGWFEEADAEVIATAAGRPVAVARRVGDGLVIATTVHEYPARSFLDAIGADRKETLF